MWNFECKSCSFTEYYEDAPKVCPECESRWYTLRLGEKKQKHLSGYRESCALGCNPHEIPKFQKKWPWMKFTPDGRCITENYTERKRVLKAREFVDLQ
jgi:hypothetical protein